MLVEHVIREQNIMAANQCLFSQYQFVHIDGFPRNEENRAAFESVTGILPEFVLFFDCSEEEMEKRLLNRNQGREDDNIETIRKRFRVYMESSLPIIEYYNAKGKVKKIDAAKPVGEVFEAVKAIFTPSKVAA